MKILILLCSACSVWAYSQTPIQYHIQTDKGPDRYFRFQTYNGQYRKEKRFDDGTVVGTYGWVDPTGLLRLYDYIADDKGYRIVRKRLIQTNKSSIKPASKSPNNIQRQTQKKPELINSKMHPQLSSSQKEAGLPEFPNSKMHPKLRPTKRRRPVTSSSNSRERGRPMATPASKRGPTRTRGTPLMRDSATSASQPKATPPVPEGFSMDTPGGRTTINYDLGNQYRKEKRYPNGRVVGEHGYVDPFGILRRTYYTSGPEGLKQEKVSYWVGTRAVGT